MKTPRTIHIGNQKDARPFSELMDKFLVFEEKIDGTDVSLSFDNNANVCIHTCGHTTNNVKQFSLLYKFADKHINELFEILSDRYVMYGAWMYCKHTIFYDKLPNYFIEYDIYDKQEKQWLSTYKRKQLLENQSIIHSVPIINSGKLHKKDNIETYITKSFFKSEEWKKELEFYCRKYHYNYDSILKDTDVSSLSEGLYIKHENQTQILGRYKFIRKDFLDTIIRSKTHWSNREVIPNLVGS